MMWQIGLPISSFSPQLCSSALVPMLCCSSPLCLCRNMILFFSRGLCNAFCLSHPPPLSFCHSLFTHYAPYSLLFLSITLSLLLPPLTHSLSAQLSAAGDRKCEMWWRQPFLYYTYTFSRLTDWPLVSAPVPREPEDGGGCFCMWCVRERQGN